MNKEILATIEKYQGNKMRGKLGDYIDELISYIPEKKIDDIKAIERELFMAITHGKQATIDYIDGWLK